MSNVIHIIAHDLDVANQLAVALSGNPADAKSFDDENAVLLQRNGVSAYGLEVQVTDTARFQAACSFRDGGNPFGLPAEINAAKRATMDMRCGGDEILWRFREFAADQGYTLVSQGE